MKVTGPNLGPSAPAPDMPAGPSGTQDPGKAEGKNKVDGGETGAPAPAEGSGKVFAERLAGGSAATGDQQPTVPASRAVRPLATSEIAAELQAGRLPPRAAVEKVLEQVLSRQIGADAPADVREKVRAALQDALENDPLLADKLRQLGA